MDDTHFADWIMRLDLRRFEYRAGASAAVIRETEELLGCKFPRDYVEFLLATDGATVDLKRAGFCFSPMSPAPDHRDFEVSVAETNEELLVELPLILIGVDGRDHSIGFRREDTRKRLESCPVFVWDNETGEANLYSHSFAQLVTDLSELTDKEFYRPPRADESSDAEGRGCVSFVWRILKGLRS